MSSFLYMLYAYAAVERGWPSSLKINLKVRPPDSISWQSQSRLIYLVGHIFLLGFNGLTYIPVGMMRIRKSVGEEQMSRWSLAARSTVGTRTEGSERPETISFLFSFTVMKYLQLEGSACGSNFDGSTGLCDWLTNHDELHLRPSRCRGRSSLNSRSVVGDGRSTV